MIERAKALALDCLGLALVAAGTPVAAAGRRALTAMGGWPEALCTILGSGEKPHPGTPPS